MGDWPLGLVEVRVEGQLRWMAETEVDEVAAAPTPELVRLVPASDPYLQTRDRELLVPEPAHRKALWKILASPGALLVDGEVAGTWRAKQTKPTKADPEATLEVTVEPFGRLTRATRSRPRCRGARTGPLAGTGRSRGSRSLG